MSSVCVLLGLCLLSHLLPSPASLPDIFPVLISFYSCVLLMSTWLYFSYVQLSAGPRPTSALWTLDRQSAHHTAGTATTHKKNQ